MKPEKLVPIPVEEQEESKRKFEENNRIKSEKIEAIRSIDAEIEILKQKKVGLKNDERVLYNANSELQRKFNYLKIGLFYQVTTYWAGKGYSFFAKCIDTAMYANGDNPIIGKGIVQEVAEGCPIKEGSEINLYFDSTSEQGYILSTKEVYKPA